MRTWSRAVAAAVVLYFVLLAATADTRIIGGLDTDRYAAMECLVEHGEFFLDHSALPNIDRIRIGDHFYSSKPPVLNFVGAAVYSGLHHGLGWSFREQPAKVVRVMIILFAALPAALTVWLVWWIMARGSVAFSPDAARPIEIGVQLKLATLVAAAVAVASLLMPYGRVLTNHPGAGALLTGAFALGLRSPSARRLITVGFLAALSATVDLIPGTMFLIGYTAAWLFTGSGMPTAARDRFRNIGCLIAGALIPTSIHFVLNRITLGTWNTAYLIKGSLDYEGSIWKPEITSEYDSFPTYGAALWHYVFGHRSVIIMAPLAVIGAIAAASFARWRARPVEQRSAAGAALTVFVGVVLIVPKFSLGLAGGNYGPRHLVPALGMLYCFAGLLTLESANLRQQWRRVVRVLLAAAASWSLVIATIGNLDPWTPSTLSVYAPLDVIAGRLEASDESEVAEWIVDRTAPSRAFGWQELGRIRWEHNRGLEALRAYRESLKADPRRSQSLYAAGMLAGQLNRLEESADLLERLVTVDPQNAGGWANLSVTLLRMNTPQARARAKECAERALRLNPESRAAKTVMAELSR